MALLLEFARRLGLDAESSRSGRWVRFPGEQGAVYVVEAAWNAGYLMWCDAPDQRLVEFYLDMDAAFHAGMCRAARREHWFDGLLGAGISRGPSPAWGHPNGAGSVLPAVRPRALQRDMVWS